MGLFPHIVFFPLISSPCGVGIIYPAGRIVQNRVLAIFVHLVGAHHIYQRCDRDFEGML